MAHPEIIIENGTGVAGANSYITAAEWNDWTDARGITHSHSTEQIEHYIFRAMDYFENLNFLGRKATDSQSLQWPRVEVIIDTYSIDSDIIPQQVKNAVYELVKLESDGDSYLLPQSRQAVKEKIGDIEVTYKDSAGMRRSTPAVSNALRKITEPVDMVSRA